jgi:GT2 family glycosyltransferase
MGFIVLSEEMTAIAFSRVDASVVITTRNRRDDTLRAVASCLAQQGCKIEILVFDDASEDGTVEAVQQQAPTVRVFANEIRTGYIHNRNRGFREAVGAVVFSIDDDAYFAEADTIARILRYFRLDETIGAVAIPYIEPLNVRSLSSNKTPFHSLAGDELRSYIGCSHAIRRDVVLGIGGYRECFIHQGEERDLCLRMRSEGWRVVYGDSGLIVHMVSPKRQTDRVIYYGARNRLLFDLLNLPLPHLLLRLVWDPVAIIRYRFALSTLPVKLLGIIAGFLEGAKHWGEREAVSSSTYQRFTQLSGHGPESWDQAIPPPCGQLTEKDPSARFGVANLDELRTD